VVDADEADEAVKADEAVEADETDEAVKADEADGADEADEAVEVVGGVGIFIQIVAVGKLKEKHWIDGIAEYMKRLGPYVKVLITEVADEKAPDRMSDAEAELMLAREAERILAQIKSDAFVFALAIEGELWTSEQLARRVDELGVRGVSQLVFVIGGSNGLAPKVLKRADQLLSFGRMTYPHQMMRLILVEQVYRAFKINRGEKYHK